MVAAPCIFAATAFDEVLVHKGESLVSALESLRAAGLQLIFSSALIGRELEVNVDPGSGSPEEVARRILAPHAAYASLALGVTPRTTLDLALRWDAQRFNASFHDDQILPRVSLQYDLDAATTFRMSWGRAAQTMRPDELPVQEGDTTFSVAQRATQIAVSAEHRLTPSASLRIEAYDKRVSDPAPSYENLLDPFALLPELEVDRVRVAPDRSRMYGGRDELALATTVHLEWVDELQLVGSNGSLRAGERAPYLGSETCGLDRRRVESAALAALHECKLAQWLAS